MHFLVISLLTFPLFTSPLCSPKSASIPYSRASQPGQVIISHRHGSDPSGWHGSLQQEILAVSSSPPQTSLYGMFKELTCILERSDWHERLSTERSTCLYHGLCNFNRDRRLGNDCCGFCRVVPFKGEWG